MDKNLLKFTGGVFFIVLILDFVAAATITTFSDGSSAKNLSFSGNENISLFLKIAQNSSLTSATLNIKDVSNTWFYQENAAVYGSEWHDTEYESNNWGKIYSNYSKNSSFFLGSKWKIAQGYENSPNIDEVAIPESCFNQEPVQFRMYIYQGEKIGMQFNYSIRGDCWDGNSWINITPIRYQVAGNTYDASSDFHNRSWDGNWNTGVTYWGGGWYANGWMKTFGAPVYGFNEEAIIWNLNKTNVSKIYIDTLNDSIIDYQNDSLWNGNSVQKINASINFSAINSNLDACNCNGCSSNSGYCTMPLIFHSDSEGLLQVSNININYCTLNLINSSTAWTNISCLGNDKMNQTRTIIQYDQNACGEISNQTFIEYRATEICDFCTPSLTNATGEWTNITDCNSNGTITQEKTIIQYDANSCLDPSSYSGSSFSAKSQKSIIRAMSTPTLEFPNSTIIETRDYSCNCEPEWVCSLYDDNGNCLDCLDGNYCFINTNTTDPGYSNETLTNLTVNTTLTPLQNVTQALNGTNPNGTVTNSTFNSTTLDIIELYVNNIPVSNLTRITGSLEVELTRANNKIAEFDYNFTNGSIDFSNMLIEQNNNNSADKAYVILRGIDTSKLINQTKTLYMNGIDRNINWICVKDAEINSSNDISQNCKGADETHVQCNGQPFGVNNYTCTENTTSHQYKITGLRHSGVIESEAPAGSSGGGSVYTLNLPNKTSTDNSSNTGDKITSEATVENQTEPNESAQVDEKGAVQESVMSSITGAAIGTLKNNSKNIAIGFVVLVFLALIITNIGRKSEKV